MVVIYSKYFKPNGTIFNNTPTASSVSTNPLTGKPRLAEVTTISGTTQFVRCLFEFKRPMGEISSKEGIKTGEVILQGRILVNELGETPSSNNSFDIAPWFNYGGKYLAEIDFLGKGHFYAMEQVKSMYDAERYFGYPILGKFVRLNNQQ